MKGTLIQRFSDKYIECPVTGCWHWVAASRTGYGLIRVGSKLVLAHRVSYELFNGEIPAGMVVDHKCGVHSCVNPEHLRVASMMQNSWNSKMKSNNTSGFKGVTYRPKDKKWQANIRFSGKRVHLGVFSTPEEAHNAYREASQKHHGVFSNLGGV